MDRLAGYLRFLEGSPGLADFDAFKLGNSTAEIGHVRSLPTQLPFGTASRPGERA